MAAPSQSSPTAAAMAMALAPVASDVPEEGPISPMASEAQAVLSAASTDLNTELGSQRPVLEKEKTLGIHERHVFLCYKRLEEWPSHLEATESDSLPRLLAAAIKASEYNLKKITKLTICEGEDGTESSLGDVLIFPDMIRYRGLTHFDAENFVEEVLVKDVEWLPGSPEAIKGSYVFVCAHGSRDKRCGVCGPALITRFKEEIVGQGLDGQVSVSACSHVGGHKYAGNVIIFSSDAKGEVTGHWYGVAPDDVPVLLEKHIGQGEIVDYLWRGQLGMTEEQQKKALELKHMTNGATEEEPSSKEANGIDRAACNPALAGGCCQGNGGGFTLPTTDTPMIPHSNGAAGKSPDPRLELAPRSDPAMKLQIPKSFDGDAILAGSELHQFSYARELQNVVNRSKNWLTVQLSFALMKNGSLFAVQGKDVRDFLFQKNGAVCVVANHQLQDVIMTMSLYTNSNSAELKEHKAEEGSFSGTKILKSEFGGKLWLRRKYSFEGDNSYHVLQWRPQKSDNEDKAKPHVKARESEEEVGVESSKQSKAEKIAAHNVDDFSIENCIYTANKMQELSVQERAKACDIFRIEQNRMIFISVEPATRLVWLRNQIAAGD